MHRWLLALLLCIACPGSNAEGPTKGFVAGSELVIWMREHEALLAHRPTAELVSAGFYQGYVLGVYDDLSLQGMMCVPIGTSVAQMTAVVTKYLRTNPEKWSQSANLLVVSAFAQAFPCRKAP